ncbi:type 1 glutamine amidotransferase [Phyllobacterium salinisoli]|uniref:Type 1 glutamine amidotransferase n=1 Tax=Phyllobacterium salinisoli TaxID=1899321 RepID=A0A368K7M0_9HYPH|nr:type 1 glutamine amidotransferase [Phyllobacterium salinisoli]RCS24635.1 type 1 glutamine amidotransferase [Phyllobacterium salinisoli]
MRVLTVQNYRGTGLGQVDQALAEAGAEIDLCAAYLGDPLPQSDDGYDALIVLGGEQNALADDEYPYLPALTALIRDFGDAGKAVLGICLGSQLVARAYGGKNILDRPVEFGWHEVRISEAAADDPVLSALPAAFPIFHWHSDTFSLPQGAVHLASSDKTANQAFRLGRAVYGIQFHFEADRQLVDKWNSMFGEQIREYHPGWLENYVSEAALNGPAADAAGLALARAWVRQI